MNDTLLIAECAQYLPKELLQELVRRLTRKAPAKFVPTDDERSQFEELWTARNQFIKRPGDPKGKALEQFARQMREKPVSLDEIKFGIRGEYGSKRDDPSKYAQFVTFMSQRRWENYDFAGHQARLSERQENVVPIRRAELPANHFSKVWAQRGNSGE